MFKQMIRRSQSRCYSTIILVCAAAAAQAQTSFDEFRNGILGNYQEFRKGILDDYANFLEGVWADYDAFRGIKRDTVPKFPVPPEAPVAVVPEEDENPVVAPEIPAPIQPEPEPEPQPEPQTQPEPEPQPKPQPEPQTQPEPEPQKPAVTIPEPVIPPMMASMPVAYKDIRAKLPKVASFRSSGLSSASPAEAWRGALGIKDMDKALKAFEDETQRMRLPDWWEMNLAISYGKALNPDDYDSALLFAAIMLVNRGYDIKVAQSDKGVVLLYRSDKMIYARPYFVIDNHKYYLLGQEDLQTISTYSAPGEETGLRSVDLRINAEPALPKRMKQFSITDGKIAISGEVDGAMVERLRDYPQIEIPEYAASVLQEELRSSVKKQLKEQIEGMSQWEAANALISLVQHGFKYATDDEQFGFEKPFFMEELLYWPMCDCEDRSVFYAWIANEVLGIDAHLLHYPGHEATAIALSEGKGSRYEYGGRLYYIADPTYIGAQVGLCMPQFLNVSPEIQLIP